MDRILAVIFALSSHLLSAQYVETQHPGILKVQELYNNGQFDSSYDLAINLSIEDTFDIYDEQCINLLLGLASEASGNHEWAFYYYETGLTDPFYTDRSLIYHCYDRYVLMAHKHYLGVIYIPHSKHSFRELYKPEKVFIRGFRYIESGSPFESELCYYAGMWRMKQGEENKAMGLFQQGRYASFQTEFSLLCKEELLKNFK